MVANMLASSLEANPSRQEVIYFVNIILNFQGTYCFADGLEYADENWKYCNGHDRRFASEVREGLNPAGNFQT